MLDRIRRLLHDIWHTQDLRDEIEMLKAKLKNYESQDIYSRANDLPMPLIVLPGEWRSRDISDASIANQSSAGMQNAVFSDAARAGMQNARRAYVTPPPTDQ